MIYHSRLERVLRSGQFTVTAEVAPPDSADAQDAVNNAKVLAGCCDALNATDASGANCHMSSIAVCALMAQAGYDPVLQISCRDRNRIAVQGDLLGAAALGVHNVLLLTGDAVQGGDHPEAKPVFDLDSITALRTASIIRDRSRFLSGREITKPPQLFFGAACNPFAPPFDFRPLHLKKKIEAGAQFIQTQYCYDMPKLVDFMKKVVDMGLHERAFILVGVGPLRSSKAATWMRDNVAGVHIPDNIIARLEGAPKGGQRKEGEKICAEIIQQVKEVKGVAGVHVMAFKMEESVAGIIRMAGLPPRITNEELDRVAPITPAEAPVTPPAPAAAP